MEVTGIHYTDKKGEEHFVTNAFKARNVRFDPLDDNYVAYESYNKLKGKWQVVKQHKDTKQIVYSRYLD